MDRRPRKKGAPRQAGSSSKDGRTAVAYASTPTPHPRSRPPPHDKPKLGAMGGAELRSHPPGRSKLRTDAEGSSDVVRDAQRALAWLERQDEATGATQHRDRLGGSSSTSTQQEAMPETLPSSSPYKPRARRRAQQRSAANEAPPLARSLSLTTEVGNNGNMTKSGRSGPRVPQSLSSTLSMMDLATQVLTDQGMRGGVSPPLPLRVRVPVVSN